MQITWNADVDAPCCAGEIVAEDGRTLLIQTDWDYCGTAGWFGWNMESVQKCCLCGKPFITSDGKGSCEVPHHSADCDGSEEGHEINEPCSHDNTDGTVDCKACGLRAGDFMAAAYDWLRENNGATADDPGYFN